MGKSTTYLGKSTKNDPKTLKSDFFVVGIGASAGGVSAILSFFQNFPKNIHCSFVVVQHLDPNSESMMKELLSRHTSFAVEELVEDKNVVAQTIYLVHPKKNVQLKGKTLMVTPKPANRGFQSPIDHFFSSLALAYEKKAVAIILSGTGNDGSQGIRTIHDHGGLVMAQLPEEAEFNGMINAAIYSGAVDYILPTKRIAGILGEFFADKNYIIGIENEIIENPLWYDNLLAKVNKVANIDFSNYKTPTLARRITRRIHAKGLENFNSYYLSYINEPDELKALAKEFLVGVTDFFRDLKIWKQLKSSIIPAIIDGKKNGDTIKVWSVACSTGEEAFSLAILFQEALKKTKHKQLKLKIFATDIDNTNTQKASLSFFDKNQIKSVPKKYLDAYFEKTSLGFRVVGSIRKQVIFCHHDILKDTPFIKMDLVLCRNMLIYMKDHAQDNVVKTLQYALNQKGFLVLGKSESLGNAQNLFEEVNGQDRIYQNILQTKILDRDNLVKSSQRVSKNQFFPKKQSPFEEHANSKLIEQLFLEELGFSCLYLDHNLNIIKSNGDVREYLKIPEEGFSSSIFSLVPETLKPRLTLAFINADKNKESVHVENIGLKLTDKDSILELLVVPEIKVDGETTTKFIVVFMPKKQLCPISKEGPAEGKNQELEEVVVLKQELSQAHNNLISLQNEIELRNEQLLSANEELLATNEELQSTNEELQSTNEELHSTNEELNTVNEELNIKIENLAHANASIDNILKSINITTLMLDKELNIVSFTDSVNNLFNFNPSDLGRPLADITHNFGSGRDEIFSNVKKVLRTGKAYQKEIKNFYDRWFLMRINPYKETSKTIDGVVITYVDITEHKKAELKLLESEAQINALFTKSPDMIWAHDSNGIIFKCNDEFAHRLGYGDADYYVGTHMKDYIPERYHYIIDEHFDIMNELKPITAQRGHFKTKSGEEIPYLVDVRPIVAQDGTLDYIMASCKDIAQLVQTEKALEKTRQDYKKLFNNAPDMFVAINAKGDIVNCNLELVHKLGHGTPSDLIGKSILEVAPGFTEEELKHDITKLMNGESLDNLKRTVITKNGSKIPVRVNARSFFTSDGQLDYIVGSWRDVTQLDKAETMLKNQMQAFEQTSDSFWIWNLQDNSVYRSKSIYEMLGYDKEDVEDTFETFIDLMHPDDLEAYPKILRKHIDTKGQHPYKIELRYKTKDGSYTHLYTRGRIIEWAKDGSPIKMMGTETDVTELKKLPVLEAEVLDKNMVFNEVLESTMAGFWDWNIPEHTEYLSPTFKKMFGYEDDEMENSPDSWQKIIHPDDLPGVFKVFEDHVKSKGKIPYENEVRYYHKDGKIIWVWCRGKVIEWGPNNEPIRMVGSHVDITNLRDLSQSNRQLERFAYVASHDLQEPLRTVNDFVALFKEEYVAKLDENASIYLDFIESASKRMGNLVKGILEYSRIEGNTKHEKVDLNHTLKNVVDDLQLKIADKNAEVVFNKMPVVKGNPIELHSLFLNLIGNAIKFVADGQVPKVEICSRKGQKGHEFAVKDNGIGIKKEDKEKIFEIFTRLHNEDTYKGTGIGLAHCKKIVELHGGEIWVVSKFGKGSNFYFTLN